MEHSAKSSQRCCKIRNCKIPDVNKRIKISTLLAKFNKKRRKTSAFCSSCTRYLKFKPEVPPDSEKSAKRQCSSSTKKNSSKRKKPHKERNPWNTVIINQLPSLFHSKEFTSLLARYGTVEDVYLCRDESARDCWEKKREGIAQVRFRREEDARRMWKASQEKLVKLGDEILMITLASNDYSPIQNLPDDCLREIFCCLPVEDKLTVEKVSTRWKKIGSQSWSHVKKIHDGWTSVAWKTIAARTANYLDNLILELPTEMPVDEKHEDSPHLTLASIAKHHTQLKKLGISWKIDDLDESHESSSEYIPHLRSIISNNQHLRIVYLQYCRVNEGFFDWLPGEMKEIHLECNKWSWDCSLNKAPVNLSRFFNLQELAVFRFNISKNQLKGIEYLDNLRVLKFDESDVHPSNIEKIVDFHKLEHLAISNCQISNLALMMILRNNKNLEYLDISDIEGITDSTFAHVLQLPNLEFLGMKNLHEVSLLAPMPKLEILRANGCSSITDEEIERLFTRDSLISTLTITGCSISLNVLAKAYNFVRLVREELRELHIQVDKETDQLWRIVCSRESLEKVRCDRFFRVTEYNDDRDYDDPLADDWRDFEY